MTENEKNFCCGCGEPIGEPHTEGCDEATEILFLNHYKCPDCGYAWDDEWTATCDDDCPACGARHISPESSEEIGEIVFDA